MTSTQREQLRAAVRHPAETLPVLQNFVESLLAGFPDDIAQMWINVLEHWNETKALREGDPPTP